MAINHSIKLLAHGIVRDVEFSNRKVKVTRYRACFIRKRSSAPAPLCLIMGTSTTHTQRKSEGISIVTLLENE